MIKSRIALLSVIVFVLTLLLPFGCGGSKPARFYILTPTVKPAVGSIQNESLEPISIAIGPVELSEYLLRPQIVSHSGANKVEYSEYDRWAEPLDDNFARVVAENISNLMKTDQIFVYPFPGSAQVQYRIDFEILRFAQGADGQVSLIVLWSIYYEDEVKLLLRKKSTFIRPGPTSEDGYYQELTGIMSRMVEDLCREVVKEFEKRIVGLPSWLS